MLEFHLKKVFIRYLARLGILKPTIRREYASIFFSTLLLLLKLFVRSTHFKSLDFFPPRETLKYMSWLQVYFLFYIEEYYKVIQKPFFNVLESQLRFSITKQIIKFLRFLRKADKENEYVAQSD